MNRKMVIVAGLLIGGVACAFCGAGEPANSGAGGTNTDKPPTPLAQQAPSTMMRPERFLGNLVRMDGTNLVIDAKQMRGGVTRITVATDSRTEFNVNEAPGKLEGLQPGMVVAVVRFPAAGANAGKVRVNARDPDLTGTLVKVDGTNLVLQVSDKGSAPREVTVALGAKTRIIVSTTTALGGLIERGGGKAEDLKPGTELSIYPPKGIPTRITAKPATNSVSPSPQKK